MITSRSNIVNTITLISVLLLIDIHQVSCQKTSTSRSTEVAWKDFMKKKDQPFAIVFDYKNTAISRTQCKNALEMITNMVYSTYADELADESYLTKETIELLEKTQTLPSQPNGTQRLLQEQHLIVNDGENNNNLRQRRLNLRCTAAVCRDRYQIVIARGCVPFCNRRRNLVEKIETTATKAENQQRDLQTTPVLQGLELANCVSGGGCDYDKMVTDYEIQGWKSKLVKRGGEKVAKTFYELAEKHAPAECTTILAEMTHIVVPLL